MRAYGRNLLALVLLLVGVAVGSLYRPESPEAPAPPAVEWADSPDNILLLSALLEEKGAEYGFEQGHISTADTASVKASLSDTRAEKFWQSKAPPQSVSDGIIRREEKRLQTKAERVLHQALGEKCYKQVLISLDYTLEESRVLIVESREQLRDCTSPPEKLDTKKERYCCAPLEFDPAGVAEPPLRIVKMHVLTLIEEPHDEEILEATRGFVSNSIGFDETRKDEFTLVSVPSTERLRKVFRWSHKSR